MAKTLTPDAELVAFIASALADGLPAADTITLYGSHSLRTLDMTFSDPAEMRLWAERLGATDSEREQPYPLEQPYERWLRQKHAHWSGWNVFLNSSEPITDDRRSWWIESGKATERAAYLAAQTTSDQGA